MFDFVDLFAGVGGFHAALHGLGGAGVQAAEIDPRAAEVYRRNWGLDPDGDVRHLASEPERLVKDHEVLAGGFPCQPFSKSGRQRGMSEERGMVFNDVASILAAKRPPLVLLENVRNIAGPRQRASWNAVVAGLRNVGYAVPGVPLVFSPHLLPRSAGGTAQIRERVYIIGTYVGPGAAKSASRGLAPVLQNRPQPGWDPAGWSMKEHVLDVAGASPDLEQYKLSVEERGRIATWNKLLKSLPSSVKLPGHPLWADVWRGLIVEHPDDPDWKKSLIRKNLQFMADNPQVGRWVESASWTGFPASRRKLEWQAQDEKRDLTKLLLQFRPSGIRVKKPTYAPALVAMNQTSMLHDGKRLRRLTVEEAALLQGLDGLDFGDQPDPVSYRQLGNAVNVGTVQYVLATYVHRHATMLEAAEGAGARRSARGLVEAVGKWWADNGLDPDAVTRA